MSENEKMGDDTVQMMFLTTDGLWSVAHPDFDEAYDLLASTVGPNPREHHMTTVLMATATQGSQEYPNTIINEMSRYYGASPRADNLVRGSVVLTGPVDHVTRSVSPISDAQIGRVVDIAASYYEAAQRQTAQANQAL